MSHQQRTKGTVTQFSRETLFAASKIISTIKGTLFPKQVNVANPTLPQLGLFTQFKSLPVPTPGIFYFRVLSPCSMFFLLNPFSVLASLLTLLCSCFQSLPLLSLQSFPFSLKCIGIKRWLYPSFSICCSCLSKSLLQSSLGRKQEPCFTAYCLFFPGFSSLLFLSGIRLSSSLWKLI